MRDGCDPLEANSNAVAVAEQPDDARQRVTKDGNPRWRSFQDHFQEQIAADPDMAAKGSGITATLGSLSHSHFNCKMRNMMCGKRGCDCKEQRGHFCKCGNGPIVNEDGNYCMERVRTVDNAWAELTEKGLGWEVLAWQMDVEEPEAALVISTALNKKNEAAMKIAHTEIMNTLVSLCKPEPGDMEGVVRFEPLRDRLVDLYGAAVDHPDFVQAFRLVLDAGGHDSPHMADLHQFTKVFVNPKVRKMRFEAYAVVAPYPLRYPRVKNACLKWAWRQAPKRGWCQVPPSISIRVDAGSKYQMRRLMDEIEGAMLYLSKCASMVMEQGDVKTRTKWVGDVDIGLMTKVFAVPKKEEGLEVSEQEEKLKETCAGFIAVKLKELLGLGKPPWSRDMLPTRPEWNRLLARSDELMQDPQFAERNEGKEAEESGKRGKDKSAVAEKLQPKLIKLDADGMPMSSHEKEQQQGPRDVEVIPWSEWLSSEQRAEEIAAAKSVLVAAVAALNSRVRTHPLTIFRRGQDVVCQATKDVGVGELVIPLSFKKQASMVVKGVDAGFVHPHAACCRVSWTVTEEKKAAGIENDTEEITIMVQPEFKLPKPPVVTGDTLLWAAQDAAYPFWGIKRQAKQDDPWNCEVVREDVTAVLAFSWGKSFVKGNYDLDPVADTFSAAVPILVNTKAIKAGEMVMLKWAVQQKQKKDGKRGRTWVEFVKEDIKKQKKGANTGKRG